MSMFILFLFGLVVGSFLNVVTTRYRPDRFLFGRHVIMGRSRCPNCDHELRWHELVPVLSFVWQARRCKTCEARISWQYPIVELVAGLIFAAVPRVVAGQFCTISGAGSSLLPGGANCALLSGLWIAAFVVLTLMFLIDMRLKMIPDEATILLGIVGVAATWLTADTFGLTSGTFLGAPALLAGLRDNLLVNRAVAALAVSGAFFAIFVITRGRGIGFGDVKLAVALGLLFGWPDVVVIAMLAFVIGAVVGVVQLTGKTQELKSAVPFGPYLVLASAIVFLWGEELVRGYLSLIGF